MKMTKKKRKSSKETINFFSIRRSSLFYDVRVNKETMAINFPFNNKRKISIREMKEFSNSNDH